MLLQSIFYKILKRLIKRIINKMLREAYLKGLSTGYKTGCEFERARQEERGAILGGVSVEREVEEILKRKGF